MLYHFISGAIAISSGAFGDDVDSSVLYNVDCFGNETSILNCSSSNQQVYSEHSAAVICQGINHNYECFMIYTSFCSVDNSTQASNCTDGDLRLIGAMITNQGQLEVCVNGAWGSICDSEGVFTTTEAQVACRQLGKLQVEGNPLATCVSTTKC